MTTLDDSEDSASQQRRRDRLAVFARAPLDELQQTLAGQAPGLAYECLRPPQIGMVMLRARIGGSGDAFNLGEATVTRCTVRLRDGRIGTGYVLGRERRKAELVAVLDALYQDGVGPAPAIEPVEAMRRRQAQRRAEKAGESAATRVEFFTRVRGQ